MRLCDWLEHPTLHSVLSNVLPDQHHLRPSALSISNTALVVQPLPGGPGVWDISVPTDVVAAVLSLRSANLAELSGGMSGCIVVATRSSLDASSISLGGHGTISSAAYNAIYTKVAAALNLSHKIFDSAGADISLTDAYLTLTAPSTRVLRLQWTNYSAGLRTLDVRGEVALYG
jgi:hypothetical protein